MSEKLPTSRGALGKGYESVEIPGFASWNPDATESSLGPNEFGELKNYRKERPTEVVTRTGISRTIHGTTTSNPDTDWTPLAFVEYRLDDVYVLINFVRDAAKLKAHILDPITETQWDLVEICTLPSDLDGAADPLPVVAAVQTLASVSITVFGVGNYELSPDAGTVNPLDNATTWSVVSLGKTRSETPSAYTFPDTLEGDLIIYDTTNDGQNLRYNYALGESEPIKIRLPINAAYYNISNTAVYNSALVRRWVYGTIDDVPGLGNRPRRNLSHVRTRGWGYRFVRIQKYTDSRGQDHTYALAPSVDMWVQDSVYCPPFHFVGTNAGVPPWDHNFLNSLILTSDPSTWDLSMSPDAGTLYFVPGSTEFDKLQKAFRKYFGDDGSGLDSGGTVDPYYWAAVFLGWDNGAGQSFLKSSPPYKIEVPASELKKAPMTVFDWDDFTTDANTTEIRVYRTGYCQPDEKDNAKFEISATFDPYTYGYVGSVLPNGTFTDDIALPNFGDSPVEYEGYLTDQFSGKRLTVYNDHLVLGDVETQYYLDKPCELTQCFAFDNAVGAGVAVTKFNPAGTPDTGDYGVFIQYIDNKNHWSDLTKIEVDTSEVVTGTDVTLALVIPRGYRKDIVKVACWLAEWDGAAWDMLGLMDTVDVTTPAVILNPDAVVASPYGESKNIETSHDPGAIIWSNPAEGFIWPQENYLRLHQYAPVTGFGNVQGLLVVFTDSGCWNTNLREDDFRTELISNQIGAIAPNAIISLDKVCYFLSQAGLYLTEGDGVRAVPGQVSREVFKYLSERITNKPMLLNARRASIGWLKTRQELWLHFPGSSGVGGSLAQKTFVYRLYNHVNLLDNYEFDIAPGLQGMGANQAYGDDPVDPVLFLSRSDGSLWCSYYDRTDDKLSIVDCDAETIWTGKGSGEIWLALKKGEQKKAIDTVWLTAEAHCALKVTTGFPRTDGSYDVNHGNINTSATIETLTVRGTKFLQQIKKVVAGLPIYDQYGRSPIVRFTTEPASSEHKFRLISATVDLTESV